MSTIKTQIVRALGQYLDGLGGGSAVNPHPSPCRTRMPVGVGLVRGSSAIHEALDEPVLDSVIRLIKATSSGVVTPSNRRLFR